MPKGPPDAPSTPELDSLPAREYADRAGQNKYVGPEHIIIGEAGPEYVIPANNPLADVLARLALEVSAQGPWPNRGPQGDQMNYAYDTRGEAIRRMQGGGYGGGMLPEGFQGPVLPPPSPFAPPAGDRYGDDYDWPRWGPAPPPGRGYGRRGGETPEGPAEPEAPGRRGPFGGLDDRLGPLVGGIADILDTATGFVPQVGGSLGLGKTFEGLGRLAGNPLLGPILGLLGGGTSGGTSGDTSDGDTGGGNDAGGNEHGGSPEYGNAVYDMWLNAFMGK